MRVRYEQAPRDQWQWCEVHHRIASFLRIREGCERPDLNPPELCCDPDLGGITMCCRFLRQTMNTNETYAFALTKAQTEIENLRHLLDVEKELHRDAVSVANLWNERADKQLKMAEAAEKDLQRVQNHLERTLFALEALRDSALSYHDYDCHGDNCATCCDLVESVNRANDLLEEFKPKP